MVPLSLKEIGKVSPGDKSSSLLDTYRVFKVRFAPYIEGAEHPSRSKPNLKMSIMSPMCLFDEGDTALRFTI